MIFLIKIFVPVPVGMFKNLYLPNIGLSQHKLLANIYGLLSLEQLCLCTVQQILDEKKSKHASFVQQNGLGPTFCTGC
jgi:hypothetical protein